MGAWKVFSEIVIIALMIATLVFAILAWTSSNKSGDTMDKSLNESSKINQGIIEVTASINSTNERLEKIENTLNITNTNIQKLDAEKPVIRVGQASRQGNTIGSQLNYFCEISFLNCTFNPLRALDNFTQYSVTYLSIENSGIRTNQFKVKIYYGEKEIVLVAKDYFSDNFKTDFDPINKVITLEVNKLDPLSKFRPWIFIKESDATGNMIDYKIEYASDEISHGESYLAL